MRVDLNAPAGLLLDRIVNSASFPKVLAWDGRIGVRFKYSLVMGEVPLDRAQSLAAQNVSDGSVVWLETQMKHFSDAKPEAGSSLDVTLRYSVGFETEKPSPIIRAREDYLAAIRSARLGA